MKRVLDYDRQDNDRNVADIGKIVDHSLEMMQLRFQRAQIKVQIKFSDDLVYGNPVEIQQIIVNIISNACDALAQRGSVGSEIHIDWIIREEENIAELRIANNGDPISDADRDKIFERRFTAKGSKGFGIGLFVSRRLAIRNGGRLVVVADHDWTVFALILRLANENAQNQRHVV